MKNAKVPDSKRLAEAAVIIIALLVMAVAFVIRTSERTSKHQSEWDSRNDYTVQMLDKPPDMRKD